MKESKIFRRVMNNKNPLSIIPREVKQKLIHKVFGNRVNISEEQFEWYKSQAYYYRDKLETRYI